MSLEEFRFLNPAHNKPVIKANGSETIVLPIEKVAVFQSNLETHSRPLVSWQAYTVKRSDQPEKIAAKHGMTLAQLKEANGIPGNKKIVAGQTLLVPLRDNADPHLPDLPAPKLAASRSKPRRAKCYQVSNSGAKKQVAVRGAARRRRSRRHQAVAAAPAAARRPYGRLVAFSALTRPELRRRPSTGRICIDPACAAVEMAHSPTPLTWEAVTRALPYRREVAFLRVPRRVRIGLRHSKASGSADGNGTPPAGSPATATRPAAG